MTSPNIESGKRPAIDADDVASAQREIGQITARDFLTILDREGLGAASLTLLPEKKKVELYAEPEWNRNFKVSDIVRVLKTEKKKVELEVPLDFGSRINPGMRTGLAGGATGFPTDDDTRRWPPHIEIRKTSLDHRFDMVMAQVAQLQVTVQELNAKLERSNGR